MLLRRFVKTAAQSFDSVKSTSFNRLIMSHSHGDHHKRQHLLKRIGTHNGTFHCDEVLACFMLRQLTQYKGADVVRTRDPSVLETCDIVVDVGGVYDPKEHKYDHHQRLFTETMNSIDKRNKWVTKLSSAGLVYAHFGHDVISHLINKPMDDPVTKLIYNKMYENFVEEIDAIDNGISQTDGEPRYQVSTTLSCRVSHLNPSWNQPQSDPIMNDRFHKAMELVGSEFKGRVDYYMDSWLPARSLVEIAFDKRLASDDSGEIVVLEQGGCPWKEHLFTIEEERDLVGVIKYVLYTDAHNKWRVHCVPVRLGSFETRLPLLEEWRGVRDEELSKLSGIADCIFVHASGFIGGNKTYDGALEMAKRCLKAK